MKSYFFLFFCVLFATSQYNDEQLLFVWQLHRHGARAPYLGVVNGIDCYKEKWSQIQELSDVGKRTHYLLGVKNRKKYIEKLKFITESYDPQEVLIYSTDVNRTLESIYAQLQGFYQSGKGPKIDKSVIDKTNLVYPPNKNYTDNFNKIIKDLKLNENYFALPKGISIEPVHTFFPAEHTFALQDPKNCPGLKPINEKQIKREEIKNFVNNKIYPKYKELFKTLENAKDDNFMYEYWTLYKYMDGLISDHTDDRKFYYPKSIYQEFENEFENLKKLSLEFLFMDYTTTNFPIHDISIAAFSYTMNSIINWMEKAIESNKAGKKYTKYVIYSGHDANIGALEDFMKYAFSTEVEYSKYAETRYFELVKIGDDYKVRYLRSNDTQKIDVKFEDFKKIIKEKTWSDEKVAEFCQFNKKSQNNENNSEDEEKNKTQHSLKFNVYALSGINIFLIVVAGYFYYKVHLTS